MGLNEHSNSCVMCGEHVPDDVVGKLALYSIPPICSMECMNAGAEILCVELRANLRERLGFAP